MIYSHPNLSHATPREMMVMMATQVHLRDTQTAFQQREEQSSDYWRKSADFITQFIIRLYGYGQYCVCLFCVCVFVFCVCVCVYVCVCLRLYGNECLCVYVLLRVLVHACL